MSRLEQLEVLSLKATAKRHYLKFAALTSQYDCGVAMASYINPDVEKARKAFNDTMDKLATLDPSCPPQRL